MLTNDDDEKKAAQCQPSLTGRRPSPPRPMDGHGGVRTCIFLTRRTLETDGGESSNHNLYAPLASGWWEALISCSRSSPTPPSSLSIWIRPLTKFFSAFFIKLPVVLDFPVLIRSILLCCAVLCCAPRFPSSFSFLSIAKQGWEGS